MEFRSAKTSDYDLIVSLYKEFRPDWTPQEQMPQSLDKYPSVVAVEKNKVIGFAYCYTFAPDILELANIYVSNDFRLSNIGSQLLENLEDQITQTKFKGLILTNSDLYKAEQDKPSATQFYLKNGYQEIAGTEFTKIFYKEIK